MSLRVYEQEALRSIQEDMSRIAQELEDKDVLMQEHLELKQKLVDVRSAGLGVIMLPISVSVTTACAKRTGAAASIERRRREPARAISPD